MKNIHEKMTIAGLKQQAKRLRAELEKQGQSIGHGAALELMARQRGYKDWNTIYAALGNEQPACPVSLDERVSGRYLGKAFSARVTGMKTANAEATYRLTLEFDQAVDVVSFESFSNFRKRVSCLIDATGRTPAKTSNGNPQLVLD